MGSACLHHTRIPSEAGAPPWRLYEALVREREGWLNASADERTPALTETVVNERVVLAPWVHEEITDVEVLVATDGGRGSLLTVLVHAAHELPSDRRKDVKHRLGKLFGEALRDWVEPY